MKCGRQNFAYISFANKMFRKSFWPFLPFYVYTIAVYLNYKDIMMAYKCKKISFLHAQKYLTWTPCIRWLFSSFIWKNMSFGRETLLACVSNSFSAYITSSWTFRSLFRFFVGNLFRVSRVLSSCSKINITTSRIINLKSTSVQTCKYDKFFRY